MQIIHNLGALSINRNANENAGFLLTNKKGSYCSFFNSPTSRYQGLFYFDAGENRRFSWPRKFNEFSLEKTRGMYKFVENIEVVGDDGISNLKNGFYYIERIKNDVVESLLMPKGFNSLIYELSHRNEIDLILDCKKSYDNREWGRYYDISEESGLTIIKFTKKTDWREDKSDGMEEFVLYLVVKSDAGSYAKNNVWIERHYIDDEERNSPPFKRHVYNALRLKGTKFVFSMSKNRSNAIKECNHVFDNLEEVKNKEKIYFFDNIIKNESVKKVLKNNQIGKEVKVAYINSFNSLNNLVIDDKKFYGIFAGLPWFFQFWARDTLISLKALSKINSELAQKMLFGHLDEINEDGRLPNLVGKRNKIEAESTDAHGWLFFRCKGIIGKINKNKEIINSIKSSVKLIKENGNYSSERIKEYLKRCNSIIHKKENEYHKILCEIENYLEKSLNGLLKFHTNDSFEINQKLETWMDTEFNGDDRAGIRIEIQALRLSMYKLMFELAQNQKYRILENLLKNNIRKKFWNGRFLADGLNDFTIRPNMFIAAYVYPELLTQKEWETCFENALKNLWLDWGGLSTIDKNSSLFTDTNTGEYNRSYHRGDSWFWVNNLAALVLNKTNNKKYKKYIQKILDSSTEEILWKGCIGCHAELSSAKELSSKGCFNQAWSNAMFIEFIDEMFTAIS